MASRIQLRRNSAANWVTDNPVLAVGEPGMETDTSRIKVGNGTLTWNDLPYAAVDAASFVSTAQLVLSPIQPPSPTVGMVWIQTLI